MAFNCLWQRCHQNKRNDRGMAVAAFVIPMILMGFLIFGTALHDIATDKYLDKYPQQYLTKDNMRFIVEQVDIIAVADHQLP